MPFTPTTVYGVDFSGAALAGRNTWIARAEADSRGRLHLRALDRLADLAGAEQRDPALACLVRLVLESDQALWGMDFPFGLPVEIVPSGSTWRDQLADVAACADGAVAYGRKCVQRTLALAGTMHLRRATDVEARTPFDCYHYRIIYQMFHGMRDVLLPLSRSRRTVVAPFDLGRLATARRVVVESCPGSTLKRWGAPHQNYKQPAGGPLAPLRRRTRRAIVEALSARLTIEPALRGRIMRNPGGDALDAAIAAAGAAEAWARSDPSAVRRHPRYRHEGLIYF